MALTRKFLSALGIEPEKIDQIIEAHTESTDALKEQRDQYKADAEKLPTLQQEIESLRKESIDGDVTYKEKYEKEHEAFEQYKEDQAGKEAKAKKAAAYTDLLKEAGISDKHLKAVLKVSDVDSIELDDEGNVKDAADKVAAIKEEWSDFVTVKDTKGADVPKPPIGNGGNGLSSDAEYARARFAKQYAAKYGADPNDNSNGGKE